MKPNPSTIKLRDHLKPHRQALEALALTLQKGDGDGLLVAGCIRLAFEMVDVLDAAEAEVKDALLRAHRARGLDRLN